MENQNLHFSTAFSLIDVCEHEIVSIRTGYLQDIIILSKHTEGQTYYITHWVHKKILNYTIYSHETFHYAQTFKEGFLLGRGWSDGPEDKNAYVYNKKGELLDIFYIGHGVDECQVSFNNKIWVSYDDEGIYSGQPVGFEGLVCLNEKGVVQEAPFTPSSKFVSNRDIPLVDSCYSMNITKNDDIWIVYYSGGKRVEVPLIQLTKTKILYWGNTMDYHIDAIAVGNGYVVLGRRKNNSVMKICLDNWSMKEFIPVNDKGGILNFDFYLGRDSILWGLCNNILYYVDVTNSTFGATKQGCVI